MYYVIVNKNDVPLFGYESEKVAAKVLKMMQAPPDGVARSAGLKCRIVERKKMPDFSNPGGYDKKGKPIPFELDKKTGYAKQSEKQK